MTNGSLIISAIASLITTNVAIIGGETRKYTQANPNWIPKTKPNKIGNNRWDLDFIPFVITNLFIPKYLDTLRQRVRAWLSNLHILSFFLSLSKQISERRRPLLSCLSVSFSFCCFPEIRFNRRFLATFFGNPSVVFLLSFRSFLQSLSSRRI